MGRQLKVHRELLAHLPKGYWIGAMTVGDMADHRATGKHLALYAPDGNVVRNRDGMPILVSITPTDRGRTLRNQLAEIRKAGVPLR